MHKFINPTADLSTEEGRKAAWENARQEAARRSAQQAQYIAQMSAVVTEYEAALPSAAEEQAVSSGRVPLIPPAADPAEALAKAPADRTEADYLAIIAADPDYVASEADNIEVLMALVSAGQLRLRMDRQQVHRQGAPIRLHFETVLPSP